MRSAWLIITSLTTVACAVDGSAASTAMTSSTSTGMDPETSTAPLTGSSTGGELTGAIDCEAEPDALFTKRIEPLLQTERPKTCNTCHLSGVDLQMFVQETPCQTMACLDARGLVDLSDPGNSLILQWISRADPDSPLINQAVIDEEYAAFRAWIDASATCGLCYTGDEPCGEPVQAVCDADDPKNEDFVDPGDCSPVTREALFRHRVYAWRDRCSPCHFDNTEVEAPKWIATGPCELASLTTMRNVLDRGLVDFEDPAASLLLLKPLSEKNGGVKHGGDAKFADVNDPAYIDFLSWIARESACVP